MPTLGGNSTTSAMGENTSTVHPNENSAAVRGRDVVSRTVRLARNPDTAASAAVGYSSGDVRTLGKNRLMITQSNSDPTEMTRVSSTDARGPVRSRNSRYCTDMAGITARMPIVQTIVSTAFIALLPHRNSRRKRERKRGAPLECDAPRLQCCVGLSD